MCSSIHGQNYGNNEDDNDFDHYGYWDEKCKGNIDNDRMNNDFENDSGDSYNNDLYDKDNDWEHRHLLTTNWPSWK